MTVSVTEELARFISGFEAKEVFPQAISVSKAAVLDTIGVALAGSQEPVSKIVRGYVQSTPSVEEATLWGTPSRVSSLDAALVNGAMSHALDYDDNSRPCLGHPSSVLVPALFAVAEKTQSSGTTVVENLCVGG